jgi:hypothetical protein
MTGPSKRLEDARKAFEHGDKQASERAYAHKAISQASEEHGGAESQYLGEMVYGGLDGMVQPQSVVDN